MPAERLLQISVAAMSAVGALFLSTTQDEPTMAVVMLFVAATSVVFTDKMKWLRINRPLASLWVLGSMIYAFWFYQSSDGPRKLMAVANLLVYIQVVLLYQEKNPRLYWQLITLSFLEVVISAALSSGSAFGGLLILYLAIVVVALTSFFVLRETLRITASAARENGAAESRRELRRNLLGAPPVARFDQPAAALAGDLLRHCFPRPMFAMGLATFAFAVVAFYAMPRLGGATWQGPRIGRTATVGFSPTVSLHEMGNILQSDETVMRVAFVNALTGKPYRVLAEPYFRGTVLTRYATEDVPAGVWGASASAPTRPDPPPHAPANVEVVRQEIWLQPSFESNLFSVFPAYSLSETSSEVAYDSNLGLLYRQSMGPAASSPFHYVLGTGGLAHGGQPVLTPYMPRGGRVVGMPMRERNELLRYDASRLRQLMQIAERVVRSDESAGLDRVRLCRALEAHFHVPGAYRYSLEFNQSRDPALDPVEDFVANHQQGHCEYFASALAMMLRSRDVPARLVVGYHGGEYNEVGDYILVRQLHAHAWVEAYLRPADVAVLRPNDLDQYPHGAWLRLDPTPGSAGPEAPQRLSQSLGPVSRFMDYLEFLWGDYVLGMDADQQQRAVYKPLTDDLAFAVASFLSASNLQQLWQASGLGDLFDIKRWTLADWFSWRAGWLAVVLCGVLVVSYKVSRRLIWSKHAPGRRLAGALRRWWTRRAQTKRGVVPFYARFEQILARRGLRRMTHQTQQEFAEQLSAAVPPTPRLLGPMAEQIVDAFYRVRFGQATLDKEQSDAIEHALTRLDEAFSVPSSHSHTSAS